MLYSLLGRIVWRLAKRRLRSQSPGGPGVAGAVLTAIGALAALLVRRRARR